jgi:hypothetical protein
MPPTFDETWGIMVVGSVDCGKTSMIYEVCSLPWPAAACSSSFALVGFACTNEQYVWLVVTS